jgi:hypothetical protein
VAKTKDDLYLGDYSILDKDGQINFDFFPRNEELLADIKDTYLLNRMKWFSRDHYTVTEENGKIRFYNLKCDMSGFASEDNKAPTTFYFEISKNEDSSLELGSGMHPKKEILLLTNGSGCLDAKAIEMGKLPAVLLQANSGFKFLRHFSRND